MEEIEKEYQKIISVYPNAIKVNEYIGHLRIPLENNIFIDINYKKYPKRPKVNLLKENGEVFKNFDRMISTLNKWKSKEPYSIVDIINDVFLFLQGVESRVVLIKKELVNGILGMCHQHHPREILGLLSLNDGRFTEFILIPGATTHESSGIFNPSRIPTDSTYQGTIHSHPNGVLRPSPKDLEKVFRDYTCNFIAGYPYNNLNCIKCFDQLGNELKFKVF